MLDISRKREKLSRTDLMREMRANDLVTLTNGDGIVHVVFPGTGSICRPRMIEVGTYHRDLRTWDILGSTEFENYRRVVEGELKMKTCGHCLAWYR
jgi:hypothetical protein